MTVVIRLLATNFCQERDFPPSMAVDGAWMAEIKSARRTAFSRRLTGLWDDSASERDRSGTVRSDGKGPGVAVAAISHEILVSLIGHLNISK
ncbi:hypothetical protein [Bradyrhizobium symbiodeficiens]|uniref:Uncharacterized protein n=1 Tax=Bradyrhizobium symbiodeficiens TaxID=1404367 RepID=A0A6G9AC52_9BRAD|nr:hypothetical protein [Bradyrhizobium symbiodeficiens]QDF37982.1 hypothetical protein FJN17_10575 [Bradyrhizobium symbiodeficiens]QIP09899.1 hypothetical protein HAV00_28300 [Bradyrhizobium symbiodeficiens]